MSVSHCLAAWVGRPGQLTLLTEGSTLKFVLEAVPQHAGLGAGAVEGEKGLAVFVGVSCVEDGGMVAVDTRVSTLRLLVGVVRHELGVGEASGLVGEEGLTVVRTDGPDGGIGGVKVDLSDDGRLNSVSEVDANLASSNIVKGWLDLVSEIEVDSASGNAAKEESRDEQENARGDSLALGQSATAKRDDGHCR